MKSIFAEPEGGRYASNLRRGENQVEPDGLMHNARLKRYIKGEEKNGTGNGGQSLHRYA